MFFIRTGKQKVRQQTKNIHKKAKNKCRKPKSKREQTKTKRELTKFKREETKFNRVKPKTKREEPASSSRLKLLFSELKLLFSGFVFFSTQLRCGSSRQIMSSSRNTRASLPTDARSAGSRWSCRRPRRDRSTGWGQDRRRPSASSTRRAVRRRP